MAKRHTVRGYPCIPAKSEIVLWGDIMGRYRVGDEMMKSEPYRLTVRHVMSKDVVSVEPNDSLHTCISEWWTIAFMRFPY